MKKRRFKKFVPSYFLPIYRATKLRRSSKFRLLLNQTTVNRKEYRDRGPRKYVNNYRLGSVPDASVTATAKYFLVFRKKNWVFTTKSLTLDVSSLAVLGRSLRPSSSPVASDSTKSLLFSSLPVPHTLVSPFLSVHVSCANLALRLHDHIGGEASSLQASQAYSYCTLSSVSGWFFLKKRLSRLVPPSQTMVLGYGFKRFILDNPIFYPHAENVKIFRNLVFSSFSSYSEYTLRHVASSGSLISLLTNFRRYTFPKRLGLSLTRSALYMLRVKIKTQQLGSSKLRRSKFSQKKKSRVRYKVILQQLTRLKWRLKKNKNVMRRTLSKLERRIDSARPPSSQVLERYNVPRFFAFSARALAPRSLQRSFNAQTVVRSAQRQLTQSYVARLIGGAQNYYPYISKEYSLLYFFQSPLFFKIFLWGLCSAEFTNFSFVNSTFLRLVYKNSGRHHQMTNLTPFMPLRSLLVKKILSNQTNSFLHKHALPWVHNSLVRFMEDCSGKRVMLQIYSFITQNVDNSFLILYRRWMPRMRYYEQRLGHKFFLGEALSIMHLSFIMHDPKLLISWFSAIIKRISFWKTRLVFRFFRYLIQNYFSKLFSQLQVKGIKVRLKGKISVSGNSRKRTILYRAGLTSHSTTKLRVLNEFTTINTFTGVMGFQIWLFY